MDKKDLSCIVISAGLAVAVFADGFEIQAEGITQEPVWDEAALPQDVRDEINAYFEQKEDVLQDNVCGQGEITPDYDFSGEIMAFESIQNKIGASFLQIKSTPLIVTATQLEEGIGVAIYEWVGIDYSYSGKNDDADYMGYGTRHYIVFEKDGDAYALGEDIYNDKTFTGISSGEYTDEMDDLFNVNQDEISDFVQSEIEEDDSENLVEATSTTSYLYSAVKAVQYAHQYCGIAASGKVDSGTKLVGNHSSYYNGQYPFYENADCANFVSQCLLAGGLSKTSTWQSGTEAWIGVVKLKDYLISMYGKSQLSATYSNMYPGNPIYWLKSDGYSTNHVMICTGKNSSGIPVIDAHNSDCYRIPISTYSGYKLYTILMKTSYTHSVSYAKYNSAYHYKNCLMCKTSEKETHTISSSYSYTSTYHYKACSKCSYQSSPSEHNYIYSGSYKTCRICGYKTLTTSTADENS